ncbi:hypothetical protein HN588_10805 [Candidatus Bathyarchaeota archaeon]|nr:hypothetical protein [Candidatus Bathyarchaeota archaeon]
MPNERNPFAVSSGGRAGQPVAAKPKAVSTPNGGLNTAVKTGDKNSGNRIASALGRAGAAVIGDPKHPFAQIGNLIAGEAEQDIFSSTVSDLLEGKNIEDVDTRGLSPEQISEALRLKKEGQATRLGTNKELLSQLRQVATLENISDDQRAFLNKNVFTAAGMPVDSELIDSISGEAESETQTRLMQEQARLERFAQYQGAQQDIALVNEKGGIDKAIANIQAATQLDVAATSAVARLLGIQLDIAGQVEANKARYGDDPLMPVKLTAVLQYMAQADKHEVNAMTPAERNAEFIRVAKAMGLEEFATGLENNPIVGGTAERDEFLEVAEGADVVVAQGEEAAAVPKEEEGKKKKTKEPKEDSNRAKKKVTGIFPSLRGDGTSLKKPARRVRPSRFE